MVNPQDIEIGDTITVAMGIELCKYYGFTRLADRITAEPDTYIPFKFDGCSGVPDQVLGLFTGKSWQDITYNCCLPHDLAYAYGASGDKIERKAADDLFYNNLVSKADMRPWIANIFRAAVERGGAEWGLSFSWCFAHKEG